MGFFNEAAGGKNADKVAVVALDNSGTNNPPVSQASVQRMAGPPALVMMPTRFPLGKG